MWSAAYGQSQRGPFALDKGFPSEPDSPGSIKVFVWTWCLEVLKCISVLFLITYTVFGAFWFFVVEERSLVLICSGLRRIHHKVNLTIVVYGYQTRA